MIKFVVVDANGNLINNESRDTRAEAETLMAEIQDRYEFLALPLSIAMLGISTVSDDPVASAFESAMEKAGIPIVRVTDEPVTATICFCSEESTETSTRQMIGVYVDNDEDAAKTLAALKSLKEGFIPPADSCSIPSLDWDSFCPSEPEDEAWRTDAFDREARTRLTEAAKAYPDDAELTSAIRLEDWDYAEKILVGKNLPKANCGTCKVDFVGYDAVEQLAAHVTRGHLVKIDCPLCAWSSQPGTKDKVNAAFEVHIKEAHNPHPDSMVASALNGAKLK